MRDPADLEGVAGLLHVRPSLAVDSDTGSSDRQIPSVSFLLIRPGDVCKKPVRLESCARL
jgi:hypothetical protein